MTFDYFAPHHITVCPDPNDFCAHCHLCGDLVEAFTVNGQPVCDNHLEEPHASTRRPDLAPATQTSP